MGACFLCVLKGRECCGGDSLMVIVDCDVLWDEYFGGESDEGW